MRRIGDLTGVSEVVGALMLVLIVVVAATSFAVFIADKQEDLQRNDRIQSRSDNEQLGIVSIELEEPGIPDGTWYKITIWIKNLHTDVSYIKSISINDFVVRQFDIEKPGPLVPALPPTSYDPWGKINSTEQVKIKVEDSVIYFFSDPTFHVDEFLTVKISTSYGNTFTRNFIPPSAIGKVNTQPVWNGAAWTQIYVLDGSLSEPTTQDAEIVAWDWAVTGATTLTFSGKMTVAALNAGVNNIALTVTDQWGMKGTYSFVFTAI